MTAPTDPSTEFTEPAPASPQLERLQAIDLRPGDLIIGTLPPGCTQELAAAVATDLEARFPDYERVILPPSVGLHVIRPAATGALPPGWQLDWTNEPGPIITDDLIAEATRLPGTFTRGDDGRPIYQAPGTNAAVVDPHRPPGHITVTGLDEPKPSYLPGAGAAEVCGNRYEMPAGVWHYCHLPPSHNSAASPAPALNHHCNCGDGWPASYEITT